MLSYVRRCEKKLAARIECRLVPTRVNGHPAFGYYMRDPHCGIARAITRFRDNGVLPFFGLPRTIPASPS